ncbi:MAG: hypothetical protein L6Q83_13390, partial [Gammaproteobacteria bacterium]|nr:hypothetical protein [Gammaproteobacteria bacterium]
MNDRAPFFPRRATQLNAFAALAFSFGILGHCAEALAANLPGRIAGQFEAAASGAATYTIPIQVASGLNGLGPAIALGYDSSSGDGHAGMRWSISGLSQVHRCPLTRALDGRVQGVGLGPEDRFCLDGEPLVLQSGTHGAAGAEYRRELHGFERVIAQGREGSGPAWFEVRRPDGLVYRYGNDADSRITAPGSGEVRAWALNEVEDRFQQRMGFSYAQDAVSGEHWPAEIRWTYAAAQSPDQARYRLVFSYEERPAEDRRSGYVAGSPWRSSQRLTSIDYEFREAAGFTRVHRYRLEYAAPTALGTQRSQLASITQCGPRDCLPPTTFAWDNGRAGWEDILFELSQPVVGAV